MPKSVKLVRPKSKKQGTWPGAEDIAEAARPRERRALGRRRAAWDSGPPPEPSLPHRLWWSGGGRAAFASEGIIEEEEEAYSS